MEQLFSKTVLFVDSDDVIARVGKTMLQESGYHVELVQNGADCMQRVQSRPFDILLLDINIADVDGFTLCRKLRKLPSGKEIPIMMITDLDDSKSITKAYECGATDFIIKPIRWNIVCHRIHYILRACDDRSELARTLTQLRKNKDRLGKAQKIAQLGNWEWTPDSKKMYWSDETYSILGYSREETEPTYDHFISRLPTREKIALESLLQETLITHESAQLEHPLMMSEDHVEYVQQRIELEHDQETDTVIVAGTLQNITERIESEQQIRHLAYYDKLTGCPNRQYFNEHITRWIQYASRYQRKMAVLFLDLDNFKKVNDSFGHSHGDALLQEIAKKLKICTRSSDIVARQTPSTDDKFMISRFGGDEFILLLSDLRFMTDAAIVANRINQEFLKPVMLNEHDVFITTSIGISIFPEDGTDGETLLKNADTAMYHSKNHGKNNFQYYSESMNKRSLERLDLESALRTAVENEELIAYFQPKIGLRTNTITGAEVLLRWTHPTRGNVPPNEFIPLAEESGLIIPLGEWLIDSMCQQMQRWLAQDLVDFTLAINISAQQLRQKDFLEKVLHSIDQHGISSSALELEITENSLVDDQGNTLEVLTGLNQRNIKLAIDDFGTGYSSLSYLQKLPIHRLKIDTSFVRNMEFDSNNASLTRMILAMAQNLNLQVTAEGVETAAQLAMLKEYACNEIQGYYISKPIPLDAFEKFLKTYTTQS